MDDAADFIRDWQSAESWASSHERAVPYDSEMPSHTTSYVYTCSDAQFRDSIEEKIRPLVFVCVFDLGLITYSSCEGHNTEQGMAYRNVGILPRNDAEKDFAKALLGSTAEMTNLICACQTIVEIQDEVLLSDTTKHVTINIVFAGNRDNYFASVDEVSATFTEILLYMRKYICYGFADNVPDVWLKHMRGFCEKDALPTRTVKLDLLQQPPEQEMHALLDFFSNLSTISFAARSSELSLDIPEPFYEDEKKLIDRQLCKRNLVVSFNHAWALYVWSHYLKCYMIKGKRIVITHFDSHADLMTPYISSSGDSTYHDMITRKPWSLDDRSIAEAIISNAICPGSFVIPFLLSQEEVDYHFIKPTDNEHVVRSENSVECSHALYPSLQAGLLSLGRKYDGALHITESDIQGLEDVPPEFVWILDVDCDYFTNRYNGDSQWKDNQSERTTAHKEEKERYLMFESWLKRQRKPDLTTIALSPNFCPFTVGVTLTRQILRTMNV
jgi:hypothetical protein